MWRRALVLTLLVTGCGSAAIVSRSGGDGGGADAAAWDGSPRDAWPSADGAPRDGSVGEASPAAIDSGGGDEGPSLAPDYEGRLAAAMQLTTEEFGGDPGWLGENNRVEQDCRDVVQDFGYSGTGFAGGDPGEIGGTVARSVTPAYYGLVHPERDLYAGRLAFDADVTYRGGSGEVYLGYFSSARQGWRAAPFTGIRMEGGGSQATIEVSVTTGDFRSDGAFVDIVLPNDGAGHRVTFEWLPEDNGGLGRLSAGVDGTARSFDVQYDLRGAPSVIDRFGVMNVQKPGADTFEVYLDGIGLNVINASFDFDADPGWDGHGNADSFRDCRQRLNHDYGYSPATGFAGGAAAGEMGGLIWRTNADDPRSFYATPVGPLSADDFLSFSGRVGFTRGAVDSGLYLGFFHSQASFGTEPPGSLFGVGIEGPSRVGHYFSAYVTDPTGERYRPMDGSPVILPDGSSQSFSFDYDPEAGEHGMIRVVLGGAQYVVPLPAEQRTNGATFDRFGIVPWRPDGQSVDIFFDDLTFVTARR